MQKYRPQFRIPTAEEIEAVVYQLKLKYRGKSVAEEDLTDLFEEIAGEWAKLNFVNFLPC